MIQLTALKHKFNWQKGSLNQNLCDSLVYCVRQRWVLHTWLAMKICHITKSVSV